MANASYEDGSMNKLAVKPRIDGPVGSYRSGNHTTRKWQRKRSRRCSRGEYSTSNRRGNAVHEAGHEAECSERSSAQVGVDIGHEPALLLGFSFLDLARLRHGWEDAGQQGRTGCRLKSFRIDAQ